MLRNVSAISSTYNMSVICFNSGSEQSPCWKYIHLLKTCFGETFIWLFYMKSVFPEIWVVSNYRAINQISASAKTLIIPFHLHIWTNNQWLADVSRYYTSHTFVKCNNTFRFKKLCCSLKCLVFSNILQIPLEQCSFLFSYVFFYKSKHNIFCFFKIFCQFWLVHLNKYKLP